MSTKYLFHTCKWCKETIGDPCSRDYREIYKNHRRSCCMIPWAFAAFVRYIRKGGFRITYDWETKKHGVTEDMGAEFRANVEKVKKALEEKKLEEKRKAIQARLIATRQQELKEEKEMYPDSFELYQFKLRRGY